MFMQSFGLLLWLLTLGAGEPVRAEPLKAGDHTRTLAIAEVKRSYIVHVPPKHDACKPTPVVLALHGATMTASLMQWYVGLDKTADEAGFIVVYLNGTGPGDFLLTWNAG